jgi:hypothetical protein
VKNLEIKKYGAKKKKYGKLIILLFQIGSGMRIKIIKPARKFQVGFKKNKIFLNDAINIKVKERERININNNLVINIENWGFFLKNNLRSTKNIFCFAGRNSNKIHLLSYDNKKKNNFMNYLKKENLKKINIKNLLNEF